MLPTTDEVQMSRSKETLPQAKASVSALARSAPPTRAAIIEQLVTLPASEANAAAKLAHIILADLPLTSRLLRAVNSNYCNPGHVRVATVSRAVGLLGFHGVRRLAVVIALLEEGTRGAHRARALACLARSVHAAAQARGLAALRADVDPEEVFLAALLHDAGELQFWRSSDGLVAAMDRALSEKGEDVHAAEERILGGSLAGRAATLNPYVASLPLLRAVLTGAADPDPRIRCVQLAEALARCAEVGWPGERLQRLGAEVVRETNVPDGEVNTVLRAHGHDAACLAAACEAVEIVRLIHRP